MSNVFRLQIISPSAVVVDAHVPAVQVPGIEGDFGVLPGHSYLLSMLRPGKIDVTMPGGYHRRFFAATGYADVTPTSCTILSDHIQDLGEISKAEADEAVAEAKKAVADAKNDIEREQAEKLLRAAESLIEALAA